MRSTQAESTPQTSQFPRRQRPIYWIPPFIADTFEQARATTSTVIKIRDETTGEDRALTSWDEVPDEIKERIPPEMRRGMAARAEGAAQEEVPAEVGPGGVVVEPTTTSNVLDIQINDVRFGSQRVPAGPRQLRRLPSRRASWC